MSDTPRFVDRRKPVNPTDLGWHLDKKVPLGLIMAMIVQIVAVTLFFADIKRDIELLKADNASLHRTDTSGSEQLRDTVINFNAQLNRMDAKLDRLIERQKP